MKLTYFLFEGTPEEFDASELIRELALQEPGVSEVARTPKLVPHPDNDEEVDFGWHIEGDVPGVAREGQDSVKAELAFNPAAEEFISFLAEAGSWESVGVHGIKRKTWRYGNPLDYSHYLRLRRKGSQFGGFAYVFASNGVINLRLRHNKEIERVAPDAFALTAGHPQYRVNIQIRDEATLKQALTLAQMAYDAT
nr:hypothetical protein OG781_39850 [Streptomyces sp. NBC_00830]